MGVAAAVGKKKSAMKRTIPTTRYKQLVNAQSFWHVYITERRNGLNEAIRVVEGRAR